MDMAVLTQVTYLQVEAWNTKGTFDITLNLIRMLQGRGYDIKGI